MVSCTYVCSVRPHRWASWYIRPRGLWPRTFLHLDTGSVNTSMSVVWEKNSRHVVFPLAILPSTQITDFFSFSFSLSLSLSDGSCLHGLGKGLVICTLMCYVCHGPKVAGTDSLQSTPSLTAALKCSNGRKHTKCASAELCGGIRVQAQNFCEIFTSLAKMRQTVLSSVISCPDPSSGGI